MITSIEVHEKQQNRGEDIRFETCDDDSKDSTSNPIPLEDIVSLDQVQYDSLQGDFILYHCICFNCRDFEHVTSMCPNRNILTLDEEK